MTSSVVIYHENCPDGLASLWVYLTYHSNESPEIHPAAAGKVPTTIDFDGKNVFLLDLSFKKADLLEISKKAKSITIVDHHESAEKDLAGEFPSNVAIHIEPASKKICAAEIAWRLWFPDKHLPWFLEVVGDRDTWRWSNPKSKEIGEYLFSAGYYKSVEKFSELFKWEENDRNLAYRMGSVLLDVKEDTTQHYVSTALLCNLRVGEKDYKVYLCDCPHNFASEVGNRLAKQQECDFAAMARYSFVRDEWWISCRGIKEKGINLSEVCGKLGGGGHPLASGFTITKEQGNLHTFFKIIKTSNSSISSSNS